MSLSSPRRLVDSPAAHDRAVEACAWLSRQDGLERLVVVAPDHSSGDALLREVARSHGAMAGARVLTLPQAAAVAARPSLLREGLVCPSPRTLESLMSRVVDAMSAERELGRFESLAGSRRFAQWLLETVSALRREGTEGNDDPVIARVRERYEEALKAEAFVDRAEVFRLGAANAETFAQGPLLLFDVPVSDGFEAEFVTAWARRATTTLALCPSGDVATTGALARALGTRSLSLPARTTTPLRRLQTRLWTNSTEPPPRGDALVVLTGVNEAQEAVELVRQLLSHAERGVRFDDMAILLQDVARYRAPVAEALRRARIPAWFATGAGLTPPGPRAFLTLLACAAEGLSAARMDEYLSLSAWPVDFAADAQVPLVVEDAALCPNAPQDPRQASVQIPESKHWERLIAEARVIAGADRWPRRLHKLRESLGREQEEFERHSSETPDRFERDLRALDALERLVLPLVERLADLPDAATWGTWLGHLRALAQTSLEDPHPVLATLAELAPLAPIGPVNLDEVRRTLAEHLFHASPPPGPRPPGHVFVGPTESVRGYVFDFCALAGHAAGREADALGLRLAAGAATKGLILSFPRQDATQRSLLPSRSALELLRAANGGDADSLALVRWTMGNEPNDALLAGPRLPALAIDDTEHDLAVLNDLFARPETDTRGAGRPLLDVNPHLGRALSFRLRRSLDRWTPADGLVDPAQEGLAALQPESFAARAWSSTALQLFAGCPYRFYLSAIGRLRPRERPERVEDLDPMQYGSFVHEVQFEMLTALRDAGLLPLSPEVMPAAERHLDISVERVANRYADELAPTVARVWNDTVHHIRTDLVEWLRRLSLEKDWVPWRFELSFGLDNRIGRDEQSHANPALLPEGLRLRGSIDLVERRTDGALRATDHKTGRKRAKSRAVIEGGDTLQPVLYALALEQLFPGAHVASGRLDYCTSHGGFAHVEIALDDRAREAAALLAKTIGDAVETGFLPAYPADERLCQRCDYLPVCGPHEWPRVAQKPKDRVEPLVRLRSSR